MRVLDGPAEGVSLMLHRSPIFLRVVRDETTGRWDALDQLDDTPGPDEMIHVYRRVEGTYSPVHVCSRGRGAVSGWYELGDYRYVEIDGERFRETAPWREWAQGEEAAALLGAE